MHTLFFLARAVRMKIRLLPIYISEIGLGVGRRFLSHFHPYRFQFSTHKRSVWQSWRCVFASDWKLHCFLHIIIALIFPPIVIWFGLFSGSSSLLPYRQCSLSLSLPHTFSVPSTALSFVTFCLLVIYMPRYIYDHKHRTLPLLIESIHFIYQANYRLHIGRTILHKQFWI